MSLQDAIYEIQSAIRTVQGVKSAPNEPPDNTESYPIAVTVPGNGTYMVESHGSQRGLHNVEIQLHVKRKDLPIDMRTATPFIDRIVDKLFFERQASNFSTFDTFGDITYEFTTFKWGEQGTLGYVITLNDLKIRDTIS